MRSGARATGACVRRGARVRGGGGACEERSACEGRCMVRGGVRRGARLRGERVGRGAGDGGRSEPARGGVREGPREPVCAGRTRIWGQRGRGPEQRDGVC